MYLSFVVHVNNENHLTAKFSCSTALPTIQHLYTCMLVYVHVVVPY